jgi:4-diphosphocytidyl-2-C-methyl-D-erythritol kinase
MKLRAHAKINLSLRVLEKRPDGYHNIESVMQSISLYDLVTLSPMPSGIQVICDHPKVPPGSDNLAYKAAELFFRTQNTGIEGVKIVIQKNIPIAAGLAGGSADAAAVLYGLNRMTNQMSNEGLLSLGSQIGSDVPFCLTGGTCLVEGRGEVVTKQEPWPETYFVLVCPDIHVSAKWAYEAFDEMRLNVPEEINPHTKYFGVGIKNDLEPAVVSRHEIVAEMKEKLVRLGCSEAQMSGSGPSVFGTVRNKNKAEEIFGQIKEVYPQSFLLGTIDKGIEILTEE